MKLQIINTKNIKLSISITLPFISNCAIRGKCKYKFFHKCIACWGDREFAEDATCVINEKYRDQQLDLERRSDENCI